MNITILRFAGWSAYVNAAAFIISIVTIMIFFWQGGFWGTINDSVSVLWGLSFLPLAWVLYQMHKPVNAPLSSIVAVVGVLAMLGFAVLQTMLVFGAVQFEQTFGAVLMMTGVIGLWVLANGLLGRAGGTLPAGLVWASVILGLGNVLGAVGFWLGSIEHPLSMAGLLVGAIAGPIWAIWLGRILLSDRLPALI